MTDRAAPTRPELTRRQAGVLNAIETRGRATLPDLHQDLPELAPSAIWRVCEALIGKGVITAEGDDDRRYFGGVHLRPARATLESLESSDRVLDWSSTLSALLEFSGEAIMVEVRLAGIDDALTTISAGGMWTSDEMLVFLVDPADEYAPDFAGSVSLPRAAFAEAEVGNDAGMAYLEIHLIGGVSLLVYSREPLNR